MAAEFALGGLFFGHEDTKAGFGAGLWVDREKLWSG